jgi:hypothetical protein
MLSISAAAVLPGGQRETVRPNDRLLRMRRRTILAITAPPHECLRRSGRQDRWQGARAMASIRSEPAKPSAVWVMSVKVLTSVSSKNHGERAMKLTALGALSDWRISTSFDSSFV